ncbi:MAG TPA: hypothetical protein VNL71_21050 [Chloroflexota bacterium]|nr:hypothetical protein [Chloroflexota bacterium]
MIMLRPTLALTLVTLAALVGIIGTGLLFTAFTDQAWGALVLGLPLALGGLYWCGRALALSQQSARRRRATRSTRPHLG